MRFWVCCAAATGIIALILCFPLVSKWLLPNLTVNLPLRNAEAIVVLAGNYQERCTTAAALYKDGYAPRIILTDDNVRRGWSHLHQRNLYSIERSEDMLIGLGIPRESIVRLPFFKSGTVYDALAVRRYLKNSNLHRIILVTSDYHTRRTLWIFRKVLDGMRIEIGVSPAQGADLGTLEIVRELFKYCFYFVRYGIFTGISGLACQPSRIFC